MPEWLRVNLQLDHDLTVATVLGRIALAFTLGWVIAGIYRATHARRGADSTGLMPTLVLLTVLICMVTQVIGSDIARAFSLVGALAIVRFRTVVEDTRDTAFVIFAVAVGMAIGAGWEFVIVPLIGIPFVAVAAFLCQPRRAFAAALGEFTLTVRVGVGHKVDDLVQDAFARHLQSSQLVGTTTVRQGIALELTYRVRLRGEESAVSLVAELNGIDGIQSVELRQG